VDVCPEAGRPLSDVLADVAALVLPDIVAVTHPAYVAHLHAPATIPSLAAEVVISATNQSLDSFDQSPSATALESHVIRWLIDLVRLPASADGVFTSGATQSNLAGLLLARDHHAALVVGWDSRERGLPPDAARWRIMTSELAHFSVLQAAYVLGLGRGSVVALPVSEAGELLPSEVDRGVRSQLAAGNVPIALVLTAGTTDVGSIDPIAACTEVGREYGLWVHLDAAAGGSLLLSTTHRKLLDGIAAVDSIAIDFHKLLCQAISCGVFLVRDSATLDVLRQPLPYLDPETDGRLGIPNLVGKSLQTTRRFDALKVFVTLRCLGRKGAEALVDHLVALASYTAAQAEARQALRLLVPPKTNTVLFRWEPRAPSLAPAVIDDVNAHLHDLLWSTGAAVVGRAEHHGRPAVKLTFVNPACDRSDVDDLLALVDVTARSHAEAVAVKGMTSPA
jgi:L-2,4-diaminobutyrate decarboxylase